MDNQEVSPEEIRLLAMFMITVCRNAALDSGNWEMYGRYRNLLRQLKKLDDQYSECDCPWCNGDR